MTFSVIEFEFDREEDDNSGMESREKVTILA
jgi:hypothetical protein